MDGGTTWQVISGGQHLHDDLHAVLFTPTIDDKHYLFIGSDGGLAQVDLDDFTIAGKLTARSDYNQWLPTLQCYSTLPTRQFYGTLSVSRMQPTKGWLCTGLQDNGNVYTDPAVTEPWRQIDGGDGGSTAFVEDSGLIRNITDPQTGENFSRSAQRHFSGLKDNGTPPLPGLPPGDKNGLKSIVGDVVRRPEFRNGARQRLYLVAGAGPNIYGLFPDLNAQMTYHWELLGVLPDGLTISSAGGGIASYSGHTVLVGATGGRMFELDCAKSTFRELPVLLPKPMPDKPQSGGNPNRIVAFSGTVAFAVLNHTNLKNNYVLRLDGSKWTLPLLAGLPVDQYFYGLEAVRSEDRELVFVATDDRVYMSEDGGNNWVQASRELPRRPHGADLRVDVNDVQSWLYLSTFGRSVWRTRLPKVRLG